MQYSGQKLLLTPYCSKKKKKKEKKKAFECGFGQQLLWQQLKFRDIKVRPVKTIFEKWWFLMWKNTKKLSFVWNILREIGKSEVESKR